MPSAWEPDCEAIDDTPSACEYNPEAVTLFPFETDLFVESYLKNASPPKVPPLLNCTA